MPKLGDVVLYHLNGVIYNALVLHARLGEPSHLGADGEPLLHLAYLAPDRESPKLRQDAGYIPQIFTDFDVVHVSHEFSELYKSANNIQTPAQVIEKRGAGEWEELLDCADCEQRLAVLQLQIDNLTAANELTAAKLVAAEASAANEVPEQQASDEL